jgi:prepilin-type N-terminal cleavage/methylation domain-containing protein/prepilin-type processing-associated H-X9-DG protein
MQQNCQPRRRSGFTLIEILTVIAIIALLAAILFPVFSRAREKARATTCLSNLQQLGMAFQQYVQDAGRRYPGAGEFQKWGNGAHWVSGTNSTTEGLAGNNAPYDLSTTHPSANIEGGALYPYVRNGDVYHCPSAKDGDIKRVTYSMNCAIAGMNDVRLRTPSEIVLLVDEAHNNDGFFYTETNNSTDTITDVHNGAGNILFTDGHAKSYTNGQYPLVNSQSNNAAKALKTSLTGAPRFYDKAFGSAGYYVGAIDPVTSKPVLGSCANP